MDVFGVRTVRLLSALALLLAAAPCGAEDPAVYDVQAGRTIGLADMARRLRETPLVLAGELHAQPPIQRGQLRVLEALHAAGARLAVGLEMFRRDGREALDRWVAGGLAEREFRAVFADHWGTGWDAYRPIFLWAREHRVPLVGLNVPREITRKVARSGFASLSEEERGLLAGVTCDLDPEYLDYVRRAHGAHGHGGGDFLFFCEAQMVWDAAMAVHALDFLAAHPGRTMVILTGVAHARKGAVPRQIARRSPLPAAVILPEIPGSLDPATVRFEDADFLLVGLK